MEKNISNLMKTILFFSLLMLFQLTLNNSQGDTEISVSGLRAIAQEQQIPPDGGCTSFGFRTWDSPISTVSGYDCLCTARYKVRSSC